LGAERPTPIRPPRAKKTIPTHNVTRRLDPRVHSIPQHHRNIEWMAGSRPAMTIEG